MSNTPMQSSPYSEDWSSYRKLVVDTLKRLDERTMDTYQRVNDLAVGHAGHEKEIERIELNVDAVESRVDDVESEVDKLKTQYAENSGARAVYMWIIGIGCTIVGFVANVAVEKFFLS